MRQRIALPLLVVAAAFAGCGGGDDPGGGAGGGEERAETPEQQFATLGCASCHTLEAAGATGKTGPNLDEAKPTLLEAQRQIAEGGGGMPGYESRLSTEEIRALADYVVVSAAASGDP